MGLVSVVCMGLVPVVCMGLVPVVCMGLVSVVCMGLVPLGEGFKVNARKETILDSLCED